MVAESVGRSRGRALDVGTGKGLLALALAEKGLEVVSLDVSPEDQEVAAALAAQAGLSDRIRFFIADASCLPSLAGTFACAAMLNVAKLLLASLAIRALRDRLGRPSS